MAEDDDLHCEQQLISPLDPTFSMVVIRDSPIFAKDDRVIFPPIYHENLHLASSIYGVGTFPESPSESSSPSSSSRRSGSSSSFSLFPSDSDEQPPLTVCEFDRDSPPEIEEKSPLISAWVKAIPRPETVRARFLSISPTPNLICSWQRASLLNADSKPIVFHINTSSPSAVIVARSDNRILISASEPPISTFAAVGSSNHRRSWLHGNLRADSPTTKSSLHTAQSKTESGSGSKLSVEQSIEDEI